MKTVYGVKQFSSMELLEEFLNSPDNDGITLINVITANNILPKVLPGQTLPDSQFVGVYLLYSKSVLESFDTSQTPMSARQMAELKKYQDFLIADDKYIAKGNVDNVFHNHYPQQKKELLEKIETSNPVSLVGDEFIRNPDQQQFVNNFVAAKEIPVNYHQEILYNQLVEYFILNEELKTVEEKKIEAVNAANYSYAATLKDESDHINERLQELVESITPQVTV